MHILCTTNPHPHDIHTKRGDSGYAMYVDGYCRRQTHSFEFSNCARTAMLEVVDDKSAGITAEGDRKKQAPGIARSGTERGK